MSGVVDEIPPAELYTMTVELSVLDSLGINLYSNAAAVLSELVANAYDADAGVVNIEWRADQDAAGEGAPAEVVVWDDGVGMTVDQLNERFLTAGYNKRGTEGTESSLWARPFMGRKGIGKLSVFSLAEIVEVFSKTEAGDVHGLRIVVKDLKACIESKASYHPKPIESVPAEFQRAGTTLVLKKLRKKRAGLTASALRKRLARRFDVLDERLPGEGGFHIVINGKRVTYLDRQELKKLEFIWEFPPNKLPANALPSGICRFELPTSTVDASRGWTVRGWFGTTKKPTDLVADDEAGSLKNIIVLARKRPIQEGIIEKLDFSRLFGNYVTGQIEADFLDLDDASYEDIATSDRQRLIEDDERVVLLQDFLRRMFVMAADQWSDSRPKKEAEDALKRYPKLREWVDDLPEYQKDPAQKMIGTIASLEFEGSDGGEDRASLFRSGVLAFTRVGLRQSSQQLEMLGNVTAADLLPLLGQQDAYEAGLWVDILKSRVEAISKLQELTDSNEKEKVLQEHLFKHLWLLDPSWERATGSAHMEENLKKIDPGLFAVDSDGQEIHGRIDIRYATQSGRHLIVELKRYGLVVDSLVLAEQGAKYAKALASILTQQQREHEIPNIEVIFVLGNKPGAKGNVAAMTPDERYVEQMFQSFRGSYRLYDRLIDQARNQYQEYLDASATAKRLDELIAGLGPQDDDSAESSAAPADGPSQDGPSSRPEVLEGGETAPREHNAAAQAVLGRTSGDAPAAVRRAFPKPGPPPSAAHRERK